MSVGVNVLLLCIDINPYFIAVFVGNIPRDSQAEDLIQYFNNYGTVTDYKPIEEKSCYLRKSVLLSFINSKHAENVYRQYNHYFEGSLLSVHQMNVMPLQFEKDASILTIKYHSPCKECTNVTHWYWLRWNFFSSVLVLTCDEIYHVVSQYVVNAYSIRFDAYDDRANLIMSYRKKGRKDPLESLQKIEFINDEAVLFVGEYGTNSSFFLDRYYRRQIVHHCLSSAK